MKNVIYSLLGVLLMISYGSGQQTQNQNPTDYLSPEERKKYIVPSQDGGYIFPAEKPLKRYKQELAFLEDVFIQSFESGVVRRVIWQADHEVAITWYEPIGPNFHYYIFQAYQRQPDGTFKKIGDYNVMSSYGGWDEKNLIFDQQGFSITLRDSNDRSSITHQFLYQKPNVVFYYRFGPAHPDDEMGEKPIKE